MFGRLKQRIGMAAASTARAPDGMRLYAVGDIHGRLDLFEALLAQLEADHRARPAAVAEIICLGDYIDRGPHSKQLLDRLRAGPPPWAQWTLLRGNHEQALLDIFDAPMRESRDALIQQWLKFGGTHTLLSFGAPLAAASGEDLWATADAVQQLIPRATQVFLRALPLWVRRGDYIFVHAGVRPGVALDEQRADDLLWIRNAFLDSAEEHGAVVVHGHSISPEAELKLNRIGIDTGAYESGVLTAVALESSERRLIATG